MKTEIQVYRGSVRIGLHYIKGNKAPHFSVTSCNGADHDAILRNYPELFDVVALHLSYIDGTPIYAVENGDYHLKRNNLKGIANHFRIDSTSASCLLAMYKAIEPEKPNTKNLVKMAQTAGLVGNQIKLAISATPNTSIDKLRTDFVAEFVKSRKPIWKAEADACIKRHNLKVYGDPWTPSPRAVGYWG